MLEIHDDVPDVILFDEVSTRQILLNLVGNAINFTEKGYVKVSIKTLQVVLLTSNSLWKGLEFHLMKQNEFLSLSHKFQAKALKNMAVQDFGLGCKKLVEM